MLSRFHARRYQRRNDRFSVSFSFTDNFYFCRDICEFGGNLKAEKRTEPCNKRNYVHRMFKVQGLIVSYLWRVKRTFVAIFVKI